MKSRPLFLTLWLILLSILAPLATFFYLMDVYDAMSHGGVTMTGLSLNSVLPFVVIAGIALFLQIIAIGLLWFWKKMGFYLYAGCFLVSAFIQILFLRGSSVAFLGVIGLVILRWAMNSVYDRFS